MPPAIIPLYFMASPPPGTGAIFLLLWLGPYLAAIAAGSPKSVGVIFLLQCAFIVFRMLTSPAMGFVGAAVMIVLVMTVFLAAISGALAGAVKNWRRRAEVKRGHERVLESYKQMGADKAAVETKD